MRRFPLSVFTFIDKYLQGHSNRTPGDIRYNTHYVLSLILKIYRTVVLLEDIDLEYLSRSSWGNDSRKDSRSSWGNDSRKEKCITYTSSRYLDPSAYKPCTTSKDCPPGMVSTARDAGQISSHLSLDELLPQDYMSRVYLTFSGIPSSSNQRSSIRLVSFTDWTSISADFCSKTLQGGSLTEILNDGEMSAVIGLLGNRTTDESKQQLTAMDPCYPLNDATYFNGKCMKTINTSLPWDSARMFCESQNGTLAELLTSSDMSVIASNFIVNTACNRHDVCVITLLPSSLWRHEYLFAQVSVSFTATVYIILEGNMTRDIYTSDMHVTWRCQDITGDIILDPCATNSPNVLSLSGKCYVFVNQTKTWQNALEFCQSNFYKGTLAELTGYDVVWLSVIFRTSLGITASLFSNFFILLSYPLNFFILLSYPLNFFIYCGMSKQFRETFKRLFTGAEMPAEREYSQYMTMPTENGKTTVETAITGDETAL
ncbi:hypothetical protein Btru_045532 [Bulinus truncatus]|nr:hypothetical protein Btru_045532 [Bulinus truncatus]